MTTPPEGTQVEPSEWPMVDDATLVDEAAHDAWCEEQLWKSLPLHASSRCRELHAGGVSLGVLGIVDRVFSHVLTHEDELDYAIFSGETPGEIELMNTKTGYYIIIGNNSHPNP